MINSSIIIIKVYSDILITCFNIQIFVLKRSDGSDLNTTNLSPNEAQLSSLLMLAWPGGERVFVLGRKMT